jgi:hypothetical protein
MMKVGNGALGRRQLLSKCEGGARYSESRKTLVKSDEVFRQSMKVEKVERITSRPAACVEEEICVMKEMDGGGGGSIFIIQRQQRVFACLITNHLWLRTNRDC